jgi:hypothetical protein
VVAGVSGAQHCLVPTRLGMVCQNFRLGKERASPTQWTGPASLVVRTGWFAPTALFRALKDSQWSSAGTSW